MKVIQVAIVGSCAALLAASCDDQSANEEIVNSALASPATSISAEIPAGKVRVPGGRLVDAECVFEVPDGAAVEAGGDVRRNGIVIDHHKPCRPEQMGRKPADDALTPPSIAHAWIDDTWASAQLVNGVAYYSHMFANWWVPSNPTQTGGLLYFFPSFTSTSNVEIVQPVLQWGNNGSFGGNSWTMASWYCSNTQCAHSTAKNTAAGHHLSGDIRTASPTWTVNIYDQDTHVASAFQTPITSGVANFTNVQGGVMEVWHVSTCAQLPPDTGIQFNDIGVYQAGPNWWNENLVVPSWRTQVLVLANPSPSCSYAAQAWNNQGGQSSTALLFY